MIVVKERPARKYGPSSIKNRVCVQGKKSGYVYPDLLSKLSTTDTCDPKTATNIIRFGNILYAYV